MIDARVGAAVGAAVIDALRHRFGGGIDRHHSVVGASCGGGRAPLGAAVGGGICGRWGLRWGHQSGGASIGIGGSCGAGTGRGCGEGIGDRAWGLM